MFGERACGCCWYRLLDIRRGRRRLLHVIRIHRHHFPVAVVVDEADAAGLARRLAGALVGHGGEGGGHCLADLERSRR